MKWLKGIMLLLLMAVTLNLSGQEMVYKPVNPAFGGDTFNYQWLLSSAEAQNIHEDDNGFSFGEQSEIDSFTEGLNRQLLNKLSSDLFREQFGDGNIEPGTYMFGSLVLEISPSTEGLLISILDTNTGDQTQIIIPN